ncbi:MAG: isoprenylcysteine carboxylmethyltransferase family protein [Bacteroidales bacterium]|nr:isoprenylcysteine carboxylmethyltransferase family protein [Bacteroidales bacterium]
MSSWKLLAFTVITVFYLIYLVKQFALWRRGIQTNRLLKGKKPLKTYRIELLLAICTFVMPFMQYGSVAFGHPAPLPALRITGLLFSVTGVICFLCAVVTMKDSWRAGIDQTQETKMITVGIYRIIRNPAFLGFDLFYIGTMCMFPSPLSVAMSALTVILIHLQILEEEKFLPTVFGMPYIAYKKKTRRYGFF